MTSIRETDGLGASITQASNVRSCLRKMVSTGCFAPHERLNLRKIADRIGVSVTPVREALISLVAEGVVEGIPGQGYFVKLLHYEDQFEQYELFQAIIEFALRKDIDFISLESYSEPVDGKRIYGGNSESGPEVASLSYADFLHSLFWQIAAATKNKKIILSVSKFNEETRLVREADLQNPSRFQEIERDMNEFMDFIMARKSDRAIKNINKQIAKKIDLLPRLVKEANSRSLLAPNS